MRILPWLSAVALSGGFLATLFGAAPGEFRPDATFKGSSLTGWRTVGAATWKAANGVITATPTSPEGGWLILDKTLQETYTFAAFRAATGAKAGIMVRARRTSDGGLQGLLVSLSEGDLASYRVTLDSQGRESKREKLGAPAGRGGGRGGRGGPAPGTLRAGEWNEIETLAAGETLRSTLNHGPMPAAVTGDADAWGSFALYAGGSGEVSFQDIAWKDLNARITDKEQTSPRFTSQRISDLYYGWSAAIADINHDGNPDVVSGPFYYIGPDFTVRHTYRKDRVYNPAIEYAPDMVNFSADFNGDGWPDILASRFEDPNRPMDLYVNPKGESRLWDHYPVLPNVRSEILLLKDLDADGKPEILLRANNVYNWAHPDPANPTAEWLLHPISDQATGGGNHGMGVGDINGDGRVDFVTFNGWYEQPAKGSTALWAFHPANFGTGGAEMGVYDINGDNLADIITSRTAHEWGLSWYEQKKDGTWTEHAIMGDFASKNAGGVTFSALHGSAIVDMDGDGIPDYVTGKRYWAHMETYSDPDTYGPAVVYVYKTVRNPKAPGGAEFVPELIHNRSGVGSTVAIGDLNKHGKPDIATAGALGTHVLISKRAAR